MAAATTNIVYENIFTLSGYATMLGFSGSILGIMMGIGAGFGILATFTYPCIVQKLGLPKSGVLALGLQVNSILISKRI